MHTRVYKHEQIIRAKLDKDPKYQQQQKLLRAKESKARKGKVVVLQLGNQGAKKQCGLDGRVIYSYASLPLVYMYIPPLKTSEEVYGEWATYVLTHARLLAGTAVGVAVGPLAPLADHTVDGAEPRRARRPLKQRVARLAAVRG